jgi:hypothetical protein
MADVYPTAAGAWSTRTWNDDATGLAYGGPPLAGDNVHANGVAITIDVDITVAELRTTAGTTAVAGGSFTTSGTRVVNANSRGGSSTCLVVTSLSVQNGNSFASATTNTVYSTRLTGGGIQNGNAFGGNGINRVGTLVDSGGVMNGNSTGGSSGNGFGVAISANGIQNGNSTGGSFSGAHGTSINAGGIQNGNSTGGSVSGAHGTSISGIFHGNATGGSVSGAHGASINAGGIVFITTATGNTSGAFGVSSVATVRYVAIIKNEVGITPKSLTAAAETTSVNVPFVSFEQLAAPQSILAYGSAS